MPARHRLYLHCPGASEPDIQAWAAQWGTVSDIYLPRGKDGTRRGYAFVSFSEEQALEAALAVGEEHLIAGKPARINRAGPRPAAHLARGSSDFAYQSAPLPRGIEQWPTPTLVGSASAPAGDAGGSHHGSAGPGLPQPGGVARGSGPRIYVGGIPNAVSETMVRNYFSNWGKVEDVYFPKERGTGRRRPFCFVTFASLKAAEKAVAQSNREISGYQVASITLTEDRSSHYQQKQGGAAGSDAPPDLLQQRAATLAGPHLGMSGLDKLALLQPRLALQQAPDLPGLAGSLQGYAGLQGQQPPPPTHSELLAQGLYAQQPQAFRLQGSAGLQPPLLPLRGVSPAQHATLLGLQQQQQASSAALYAPGALGGLPPASLGLGEASGMLGQPAMGQLLSLMHHQLGVQQQQPTPAQLGQQLAQLQQAQQAGLLGTASGGLLALQQQGTPYNPGPMLLGGMPPPHGSLPQLLLQQQQQLGAAPEQLPAAATHAQQQQRQGAAQAGAAQQQQQQAQQPAGDFDAGSIARGALEQLGQAFDPTVRRPRPEQPPRQGPAATGPLLGPDRGSQPAPVPGGSGGYGPQRSRQGASGPHPGRLQPY